MVDWCTLQAFKADMMRAIVPTSSAWSSGEKSNGITIDSYVVGFELALIYRDASLSFFKSGFLAQ